MANPLDQGDGIVESFWTLDNALLRFGIAVLSSMIIYVVMTELWIKIIFSIVEGNGDPLDIFQIVLQTIVFITIFTFLPGLPVAAALRAGGFRHWFFFAVLGAVASACTSQWIVYWLYSSHPGWRWGPGALSGLVHGPPSTLIWWWTWRLGGHRARSPVGHITQGPFLEGSFLMIPPFFSDENGDIWVYKTLAGLVSAVEAIDVENDEYVFWDGSGQEFSMRVLVDDNVPGGNRLLVEEKPRLGLSKADVLARMKRSLSARDEDANHYSFDEVIAIFARDAREH